MLCFNTIIPIKMTKLHSDSAKVYLFWASELFLPKDFKNVVLKIWCHQVFSGT